MANTALLWYLWCMIKNNWCIRMNLAIRGRSGPDWNWRSGTLDDYDILLPFEGEGTLEGDGVSHSVVKGDCFLLRKGASYTASQKEGSHLKCLGMHFDFLGEDGAVIEPETIPPFHRSLTNADFVIALADRAVDAWRRDNPIQRNLQALQIWGQALFDEIIKQDRAIQEPGLKHVQRVAHRIGTGSTKARSNYVHCHRYSLFLESMSSVSLIGRF